MTDDELKTLFDVVRQDNVSAQAQTRRHFDAVVERMEHRLDAVAESVAVLDEKIERKLDDLDERIRRGFDETQAMIKF